jgi:integrase
VENAATGVIAPESVARETAPARLKALDIQVEAHLEASLAASTRAKYQRAWEQFTSWCAVLDLTALPATPRTLTRYLSDLAQTTHLVKGKPLLLTPSWIQLQLAAITLAHEASGIRPAPTQEVEVRLVMRGIRRKLGVAPRSEAAPLSVAQLREMVAATPEDSLRDVRDRCVILLGFAGALRRSEIASLDCSDAREVDGGLLLRIRRSKTDPEAAGQEVGIPKGSHQETDPVIALQRWRWLAGIDAGPLFRVIDRRDHLLPERMSDRAVSRILTRAARLAGLKIPDLSGHSLRAGFATAAAQAGASERAIANQTRHRSLATLRRYIRRGTLFEENAAGMLGL